MSTVINLTQHLLKLEPQRVAARQAFYNLLKLFYDPNAPVTVEMLEGALNYLLNYSFWQSQPKLLGEALDEDLKSWVSSRSLSFPLARVGLPHRHQLIRLEQVHDLRALIEQAESESLEAREQLQIIPMSEQQMMCLRLTRSGGLRVRVYNSLAQIRDSKLRLLPPVVDLVYGSDMELFPLLPQLIEGPMLLSARFQMTDEGCHGVMTRGHLIQKYETFTHGRLHQHPELMYAVKRIEKFFIDPHSDPFYRDLVQNLEKTIHQAQSGQPEALRAARGVLQRGQSALKALYGSDKKLTILLTNLEYLLLPKHNAPLQGDHIHEQ